MASLSDRDLAILERVQSDFTARWRTMRKKYAENMGMGNQEARTRIMSEVSGLSYDALEHVKDALDGWIRYEMEKRRGVQKSIGDIGAVANGLTYFFDFLLNELLDP
jgi:hypothetical protein